MLRTLILRWIHPLKRLLAGSRLQVFHWVHCGLRHEQLSQILLHVRLEFLLLPLFGIVLPKRLWQASVLSKNLGLDNVLGLHGEECDIKMDNRAVETVLLGVVNGIEQVWGVVLQFKGFDELPQIIMDLEYLLSDAIILLLGLRPLQMDVQQFYFFGMLVYLLQWVKDVVAVYSQVYVHYCRVELLVAHACILGVFYFVLDVLPDSELQHYFILAVPKLLWQVVAPHSKVSHFYSLIIKLAGEILLHQG